MILFGLALFELVAFAVGAVLLLLLLAGDRKLWAWGITAAVVGYFLYNGWAGAVEWASAPGALWSLFVYGGSYLALGFGFSFVKWYFFNRKVARRFADHLKSYMKGRGLKDTDDQRRMLESFNGYSGYKGLLKVIPKADGGYDTDYETWSLSSYVASWTTFWPLYAILILVEDFLKEVFDMLTKMFGRVYRRISSAAFSDIKGEVFPMPDAAKDVGDDDRDVLGRMARAR